LRRPTHGGNIAWAAALAGCSPSLILDFSASINPLGPPQSAIAAIESRLQDLVAYPDPNYQQLRESLSQLHPTLTPEWILPGNGAAELLTWACRELAEQEETRLVVPAFSDYQRALTGFSARVREFPLGLEEGKATLPIPQPSRQNQMGLLLNNPHNPTGQLFDRDTLVPYLERYALVVIDEAFMDFLPPQAEQSLIPEVQNHPNLVILRSLTKFYSLPGLRLGYAIAHPERLQRWQQWRDPWAVNTLAAAAAEAIVTEQSFRQQTWQWLPKARSQLFEGLEQLPGLRPHSSAANFLLVETDFPSPQLQQALLERHRILIRDCSSFPELSDRYFRVAVRTPEENQRLLEGLATILERSPTTNNQ
jgi:L-threonine-O-3-phosphate decarboxylase